MKSTVVSKLQGRIEAINEFDKALVPVLNGLLEQAKGLSAGIEVDKFSSDKSVKSHIRLRTQKVNGVIKRFQRDLNKIVADLVAEQEAEVEQENAEMVQGE